MPVPLHEGKYGSDPVLSSERETAYARERGHGVESVPASMLVCFSGSLLERLVETHPSGELRSSFYGGSIHRLTDSDPGVGVVGGFGIDAPATAMAVESLAHRRVEEFVLCGYAGVLDPDVGSTDVLVATEALRDEGTSYHYLPASRSATPPGDLTGRLAERLDDGDRTVRTGPTWTTDAPFRESRAEVERYAGRVS
jgi:nucleoside phosphorylase